MGGVLGGGGSKEYPDGNLYVHPDGVEVSAMGLNYWEKVHNDMDEDIEIWRQPIGYEGKDKNYLEFLPRGWSSAPNTLSVDWEHELCARAYKKDSVVSCAKMVPEVGVREMHEVLASTVFSTGVEQSTTYAPPIEDPLGPNHKQYRWPEQRRGYSAAARDDRMVQFAPGLVAGASFALVVLGAKQLRSLRRKPAHEPQGSWTYL
eukprot:gnl/TRDRNA2_/TRDRNA2_191988_c0_seq1.p1 gnl/TRDRNA2_/TRDRNA2_191988_c0~~gnl/TRDRNA2_/TRDRNA2_191988_c0_seq1.p1  ORF type:complete len:204 (+),score=26.55 gnl/TRDRNA2_/TRDRNA2_191988_c0_seq1:69-680(+)